MNLFKALGLKKQSKRMVQVQANDGTIHTLPEDHPSLRGSKRPAVDTYENRHPFSGKTAENMTPEERAAETSRQEWRGRATGDHTDMVNVVRKLKTEGKEVPEWANQYDPAHPDFKPLTRDILGYDPHYPEWDEAQTETPATVPAVEQIQTSKKVRTPELLNAAALNKEDKMNIYKVFGLKKAKKKERIPNPEGKNMAALINSPSKTDRERAHQILSNKRKKIMGIGGRSNKKQMLQHLDREFKDGGDFQEYVRVRPEPKSKSDTPAQTPAPTTTKTTPTNVTPKSSIPKLNPPKTPKKPDKEDSPW